MELVEVLDRFRQLNEATERRMFGGVGIFHNGLMFALIADNELYLKADKHSVHFFEEVDCAAFSYSKADGKLFKMSYYQAPEEALEDIEEMNIWANNAYGVALRAALKK